MTQVWSNGFCRQYTITYASSDFSHVIADATRLSGRVRTHLGWGGKIYHECVSVWLLWGIHSLG